MIKRDTLTPALNDLPKKINNTYEVGMFRALEVARSKVIPLVPVRTSRLKNSIQGAGKVMVPDEKTGVMNEYDGNADNITSVQIDERKIVGVLGTNVPYAPYVEFGTSRMRPRYFFTNGFAAAESDIWLIFQVALKQVLSNT